MFNSNWTMRFYLQDIYVTSLVSIIRTGKSKCTIFPLSSVIPSSTLFNLILKYFEIATRQKYPVLKETFSASGGIIREEHERFLH